ncbi:lipoprotein [Paenibacillus lemnae]|uniref:Lipoprotein n=1 Tax=Paenibacillus lemnae TaxID=1330551 RepID=A0A848M7H8_PAELE|nr:lipoprotein [Paenibacillus lemnae]NMO97148.1 lipoprotein [Paenibacillus lemnae]
MNRIVLFLVLLLLLTSCSDQSTSRQAPQPIGNPTAEKVLQQHADADLFMVQDLVYILADPDSWVQEEELGPLEEVGKIQEMYDPAKPFVNYMATKLPAGTTIYADSSHSSFLVVLKDGKEARYLGLVEG